MADLTIEVARSHVAGTYQTGASRRPVQEAFNIDQPRDERGRWAGGGGGVPGGHGDLPPAPGTTPIPEGHVRLYHQTTEENLDSIVKNGLTLSHAKGIEGPRAIYATETPFYGGIGQNPTLEFHVPEKDFQRPQFVLRDVKPADMIAAHYPWHEQARYFEEEPSSIKAVLNGEHDSLTTGAFAGGPYDKAIRYIKAAHGGKASEALSEAGDWAEELHPRDDHGKFSTTGGGGKPFEIDPAAEERVRQDGNRRTAMAALAAQHGMTPEAYGQAVDAHLQELAKQSGVFVRVPPAVFAGIIEDGRLKSQFESKTSGGSFNPELRSFVESELVESKLFGFQGEASARPIYGYVSGNAQGITTEDTSAERQYGKLVLALKPAVQGRTTVSGDDSFDAGDRLVRGKGAYYIPQPMERLTNLAFWMDESGPKYDALKWRSLDPEERAPTMYTEAQIHGGVKVSDIAHVYWDDTGSWGRQGPSGSSAQQAEALAKQAGIPFSRVGVTR